MADETVIVWLEIDGAPDGLYVATDMQEAVRAAREYQNRLWRDGRNGVAQIFDVAPLDGLA